jgi:arylsulfatase A-like enzyme
MPKPILSRTWPWIVAAGVIVLAFLSTFVEIGPPGDRDPRPRGGADDIAKLRERKDVNLLFIVIDTLRADRLGTYGYERDTSPGIDRLAATGVRFDRHLSQSSWTKTSMASLFTSLNPARTGILRFDHVIPPAAVMPAEVLKPAGFQTIGLYRNGWVAPAFGFDQGFDVYQRPVGPGLPPDVRRKNPTLTDAATDEASIETAMEFLRLSGKNQRWFLYMHMMDVHEYLYDEETALFGFHYSDIYDNSIRWTDSELEVLFEFLAANGFAENTLVVITADHGEGFSEHGFEGHAKSLYREMTEIPLLMFFPFRLEPGVVVESRTRNVDVWPTIFDLLGVEAPPSDGRSRVPDMVASARGEATDGAGELSFAHLDQTWGQPTGSPTPTVAVSEGTLRYVRSMQQGQKIEQLYDAAGDPKETRDHARDHADTVERLSKAADTYLEQRPSWGETPTRELSEMELGHLRALGYAVP